MSNQRVFKNEFYNNCFLHDGFIVIYNFFEPKEVDILFKLYTATIPNIDKSFYATHWISDVSYKRMISEKIGEITTTKLLSLLTDFRSVFSYFMVKKHLDLTFAHAHQDWSLVDESRFLSLNTWIPLVDVNKDNGTMRLLPQSHTKFTSPRGSNIELNTYGNYSILESEKFLTISLRAGDLLLFDSRLIHATHPNSSKVTRVAVGNVLLPNNANLCHYYKHVDEIRKIELNDDFLIQYSFGQDFITFLKNNYATNF
jgi:ectoine hydroxylase-related dioxygenase (phytanoyl-CoA dioxygenase family)